MKKTLKLLAIMIMAMVVLGTSFPMAFATNNTINNASSPEDIVDGITPDLSNTSAVSDLTGIAGKVIGLIQIASAVVAVILIAVFGFKFILGSANEKADYQKSFIPLIVGVVVVFAATSIAKLLFGIIG